VDISECSFLYSGTRFRGAREFSIFAAGIGFATINLFASAIQSGTCGRAAGIAGVTARLNRRFLSPALSAARGLPILPCSGGRADGSRAIYEAGWDS
jgi:hypothetical protein